MKKKEIKEIIRRHMQHQFSDIRDVKIPEPWNEESMRWVYLLSLWTFNYAMSDAFSDEEEIQSHYTNIHSGIYKKKATLVFKENAIHFIMRKGELFDKICRVVGYKSDRIRNYLKERNNL